MSQKMLETLDSYILGEITQITSFFETYCRVVCLVAKQQWPVRKSDAIKTMESRNNTIDEVY